MGRGRRGGGRGGGGSEGRENRPKALVIDGGTLPFVLDPTLKALFLDVARHCVSVICSRATPIQKVNILIIIHMYTQDVHYILAHRIVYTSQAQCVAVNHKSVHVKSGV